VRPNTALELTPLCGRKIVAILKAGIGPTALPIYRGGAAQRQTVGRGPSMPSSFQRPIRPTPAMFATA